MRDDGESAPAGDDAAGAELLKEQEARIAALRAAVLSGQVPDEAAFDYERFFSGRVKSDVPVR